MATDLDAPPNVPDSEGDLISLDHWLDDYADSCLWSGLPEKAEAFREAAIWVRRMAL